MRVRNKLVVVLAVTALTGGIVVTAATAPSATAATACGWEDAPIAPAGDSSSGIVELDYNTCDRSVRASASDLHDNYGCTGVNFGCHGTVSKVRVYNEVTMQEAASGVIEDGTSFTTGAIDDAGTASRACFQNGQDDNGTITWGGSICTVYF
jgi:hypothetical protein